MKIAPKFTLAVVAGVIAVHAVAVAHRVDRESQLFERVAVNDATILGRALGHAVERTWTAHGREAALELIEHAEERESQSIRWINASTDGDGSHTPRVPLADLGPLRRGERVFTTADVGAGETLYTYVPVPNPDFVHGAIEVATPQGAKQRYLRGTVAELWIVASVLVLLCAALTWALGTRLIGAPVRLLVEQARSIGRGQLDRRLRMPVRDELGELGAEIDQMCDELQDARTRLEEETRTRVEAVEQLRHADRLTTVGTLASGIAHELGTPLNVVAGHASLIRESPSVSAEVVESSQVISRQCTRMTEIIRQLLDFARRGTPKSSSCDAVEVVRRTLDMVAPIARKRGVTLSTEGTAEAPVVAGFEELQQVLANLAINAIQASGEGATLKLRVGCERKRHPASGEERAFVSIAVADSGEGMAPEVVERVFEPFFTTKDVGQGTGLGLAVAFGIVDDRGGWIDVASQPGRGTTFTVHLPQETYAD
ncbi:MAG: sensor histidine kinase [Nannocystaceae bacterium]|nr:ATP-binding protein [bacterium]